MQLVQFINMSRSRHMVYLNLSVVSFYQHSACNRATILVLLTIGGLLYDEVFLDAAVWLVDKKATRGGGKKSEDIWTHGVM